jgi:uncharacterized protein
LMDGWLTAINPRTINDVIANEAEGPWWDPLRGEDYLDNILGPGVHYAGWYDIFQEGTIEAFNMGQYRSPVEWRGSHFLVVAPGGHCGNTYFRNASTDLPQRLADEMFKELNEEGYESELLATTPSITLYVMGANSVSAEGNYWTQVEEWPRVTATDLFLTSTRTLSTVRPSTTNTSFTITYNPDDPVPTIGGANLFAGCGPQNQAEADVRDDVVTFTSEPLVESLTVVGNLSATIFFSTLAADTDVSVKLSDVYPDGFVQILADGIIFLFFFFSFFFFCLIILIMIKLQTQRHCTDEVVGK